MKTTVMCPWCKETLDLIPEARGKKVVCASCNREFYVDRFSDKTYNPHQWWILFGEQEKEEKRRQIEIQQANERKISRAEWRRKMKRKVSASISFIYAHRKVVAISLVAIAVFVLLAIRFRYTITNAGNGIVYKTDNITGKTWFIYGSRVNEVQEKRP